MKNNNINYEFVFNKIFTGSFLEHHLGHEIINFIKTDEGNRYVYLNAWGERSEEAAKKTKYVLHIMGATYEDEKYYELVAISKIDNNAKTHYNKDYKKESKEGLTFKNYSVYDIFHDSAKEDKSHLYTFIASNFYKPKDEYRILFKVNSVKKPSIKIENNIVIINVTCNPQRSRSYSKNADIEILRKLVDTKNNYVEENDDNVDIDKLDDEQCFAVISDRTNLEDSTSNQIAYFLNRDNNILNNFIKYFLGIQFDEKNEKFEIIREQNNIDLLIKSDKHIIVIENKIDSSINGIEGTDSQLNKYYKYITEDKEFEKIKLSNKHFFILEPEYSSITKEKLETLKNGDKYKLVYYHNLFEILKKFKYNPYRKEIDSFVERNFLYEQFLKGIKYISHSKAKQKQETAYIKLKQRIKELEMNTIKK